MLHRFRPIQDAKAADGGIGGVFEIEKIFEREFFEARGAPRLLSPYAPAAARQALVTAGIGRCWSLPYAHRAGVAAPASVPPAVATPCAWARADSP